MLLSLIGGFDSLLLTHLLPRNTLTNPSYFIGAVGSYLALGVLALFTVVPREERAYIAPIVPLWSAAYANGAPGKLPVTPLNTPAWM